MTIELLAAGSDAKCVLLETLPVKSAGFIWRNPAEMLDCTERSLKEIFQIYGRSLRILLNPRQMVLKISYDDSIGIEVVYHFF